MSISRAFHRLARVRRACLPSALLLLSAASQAVPVLQVKELTIGGIQNATATVPYTVVSSDGTDAVDTAFRLIPSGTITQVLEVSGQLDAQPAWTVDLTGLAVGTYTDTVSLKDTAGTTLWDTLTLTIVVTDGTEPQTEDELPALAQAVSSSFLSETFADAATLVSSVKTRVQSMFGLTLSEFTVFDGTLVNEIVDAELETINEPVDPPLTTEEEEAASLELEETLNTRFGGHSFQVAYTSSMLMQLADKHFAAGKDEAARRLYEYSIKVMDDVETSVSNSLFMLGKLDLRDLPESPTLQQRIDASLACKTTMARFFDYFPGATTHLAGLAHSYPGTQLYKLFPEALAYESYSQTVFDEAFASLDAANQLDSSTTSAARLNRVAAWELGSVTLDFSLAEGAALTGSAEIVNISPDSLFPTTETRPDDTRTYTDLSAAISVPMYVGHTYRITVTGSTPGMENFQYVVDNFSPATGRDMTFAGTESGTEPLANADDPSQLHFVFDPAYTLETEPSILVANDDNEPAVDHAFRISSYETRNFDYSEFLNAAEVAGQLSISAGQVSSLTAGKILCLTTDAEANAEIEYDPAQTVGARFSALADRRWHPVIYVSWYGAGAYCNWRSTVKGLTLAYDEAAAFEPVPGATGYRLPTEAEWYKAAAWDTTANVYREYGNRADVIDAAQANYWNSNDAWENGTVRTAPVVSYPAVVSAYGMHDASGNVWEWCEDFFGSDTAQGSPKAIRGGSWGNLTGDVKTISRSGFKPEQTLNTVGFRIAVTTNE